MKNHLTEFSAAIVFLLLVSVSVNAAPYYEWTSEYDGASPGTLYLWHFNKGEIFTPTEPVGAVKGCNEARSGTTYDPGMAYIKSNSGATFGTGGKFGWGLHNVGGTDMNDRATILNSVDFFPTGTDPSLSVEFWVRFNDTAGGQTFVDKRGSASGGYWLGKQSTGELYFEIGNATADIMAKSPPLTWAANQWYHIAGTWDADVNTAYIYRDGIAVASKVADGNVISNSTKSIIIGQRNISNYGALNGAIDELRISSIAHAYAVRPESRYVSWNSPYTGSEPGTVALWHFDVNTPITNGHSSPVIGTSTNWYARTSDTATSKVSHAKFVATGGKFGGGGLLNVGGSKDGNDRCTINSVTSPALFPTGADPSLSVEFWVKFNVVPDALTNKGQYFIDAKGSDANEGYSIWITNTDQLSFTLLAIQSRTPFVKKAITAKTLHGQLSWIIGTWYHIAGTWNASDDTARLYRNGELVAYKVSNGFEMANPNNAIMVANRATSTYAAFNGIMDELRITGIPHNYSAIPASCSVAGTVYLASDVSGPGGVRDCIVNFYDLRAMVLSWLNCNDTDTASCN